MDACRIAMMKSKCAHVCFVEIEGDKGSQANFLLGVNL